MWQCAPKQDLLDFLTECFHSASPSLALLYVQNSTAIVQIRILGSICRILRKRQVMFIEFDITNHSIRKDHSFMMPTGSVSRISSQDFCGMEIGGRVN